MSDKTTPPLSRNIAPVPRMVPESNQNVPKYNRWNPEPAYLYKSGVYRKGERVK